MLNLNFDFRVLILEDSLYIPNVQRNLIFATYIGKHGYCVILKDIFGTSSVDANMAEVLLLNLS